MSRTVNASPARPLKSYRTMPRTPEVEADAHRGAASAIPAPRTAVPDEQHAPVPVPGPGPAALAAPDGESPKAKLNRQYAEILQEVRIAQTGIQIMFASLLALGITPAFANGSSFQRGMYGAALLCAVGAAGTLLAPAVLHRLLRQRGLKRELISAMHRYLLTGMVFLAVALSSALVVILDFALGTKWAIGSGVFALGWFVTLWLLAPIRTRARAAREMTRQEAV